MAKDQYKYFRVEARELLEGLSQGVLELERGGRGKDLVGRILRFVHTLKGASRVVKQPAIAELAASTPLARAMTVPKSTTSLNGVSEFCAFAGGACMMPNNATYSSMSGSLTASKYAGGIANLLGLPILPGSASVRSL